jgi:hypothetical protein
LPHSSIFHVNIPALSADHLTPVAAANDLVIDTNSGKSKKKEHSFPAFFWVVAGVPSIVEKFQTYQRSPGHRRENDVNYVSIKCRVVVIPFDSE